MAKEKTKSAAKIAAEAPKTEKVEQTGTIEKTFSDPIKSGLDANHAVDLLGLANERFYRDSDAAKKYNIPQEAVDKINECTAIGIVSVFVHEIVDNKSKFALSLPLGTRENLIAAANTMGISIDKKLLPQPKDGNNSEEIVELPSEAVIIPKQVEKEIKEEKEISEKKISIDPTSIKNKEQLKETLLNILVKGNGTDGFYDKIKTAIDFYRSFLTIEANKSENKDEKIKELENTSDQTLLSEIANILGKCTFTIGGMAKFLFETTERSKNPVAAFCTFRDATLNRKTGAPQIDDQLVADIVKVLIEWYISSEITTSNEILAGFKKDLEVLKKDAKKNEKAIKQGEDKIKTVKEHIDKVKKVREYVNAPTSDTVDVFVKDYADNKSEGFKMARMTASKILKTYYGKIENIKNVDQENLLHNLSQYVGIICNFFLPPFSKLMNYNESYITELKFNEEKKTTESEKQQEK